MKLQDLKNVIKFSFDFTDDEIDAVFYVELEAINEKYLKQIEVISINPNYIICKFTDFIKKHKTAIKKYLLDTYNKGEVLDWLMNDLVISEDIRATDGEAIYHFIKYDLGEFLIQE